jgi:phage anti-repressor protein/transcriptional regulator with XRE-family HTH domain
MPQRKQYSVQDFGEILNTEDAAKLIHISKDTLLVYLRTGKTPMGEIVKGYHYYRSGSDYRIVKNRLCELFGIISSGHTEPVIPQESAVITPTPEKKRIVKREEPMDNIRTLTINQPTKNLTPIEIVLGVDAEGKTTAKKLYEFLELDPGNYRRWCQTNILNNQFAEENIDYISFLFNEEPTITGFVNPNPTTDYKLTASFAKKLAMTSGSKKGELARNYFITIEDKLKQVVKGNPPLNLPVNDQLERIRIMSELLMSLSSRLSNESIQLMMAGLTEAALGKPFLPKPEIEKMYNKDFGKTLIQLRTAAGYMSQRQFAIAVGISSASISRIESGDQQVEPETLKKFALVLKVDYTYLIQKAGYLEAKVSEEQVPYTTSIDKRYTITQVASELGITAQKLGRIATKHELRQEPYAISVLNKSPYSDKQIPSYLYNEQGREALIEAYKQEQGGLFNV